MIFNARIIKYVVLATLLCTCYSAISESELADVKPHKEESKTSTPDSAELEHALSAEVIFDKSVVVGLVPHWQAQATLQIKTRSRSKERSGMVYNLKHQDSRESMRLFRFSKPIDVAGIAFLIHENAQNEDDIWMYLPSMGKTRRILSSNKHDSFMGSDFSYADLMAPRTDDYRHTLSNDTSCKEIPEATPECFVVRSQVNTDKLAKSLGFYAMTTHVGRRSFIPYYIEYYNAEGDTLKTQELSDFTEDKESNTWIAKKRVMNDLERRSVSVLTLRDVDTKSTYSPVMFTTHRLGNM